MPLGVMVPGSYFKPGTIATGRLARGREATNAACSPRTTRPSHVEAVWRAAPAGVADEAIMTAAGKKASGIDKMSFSSIVDLLSAHGQRTHRRLRAYPRLKGCISGFMPAKTPSGFGYHAQTCSVTRSGCQKLNADPVFGLVCAHASWLAVNVNVPSL